jgi:hypothetical protein
VYWLARPPYLRWAAIVTIVTASLWADFGPRPAIEHPFAARDLDVGEHPAGSDLEWRTVPRGLLPPVELPGVLTTPVASGEPLLPGRFRPFGTSIPDGWWLVELEIPGTATAGTEVRLAIVDPATGAGTLVPGILVAPAGEDDAFSTGLRGMVAVPGEWLAQVASARAEGRLTVALAG